MFRIPNRCLNRLALLVGITERRLGVGKWHGHLLTAARKSVNSIGSRIFPCFTPIVHEIIRVTSSTVSVIEKFSYRYRGKNLLASRLGLMIAPQKAIS